MSRPNFFIVGAPRSGTTALFEYLSRHPDVGVASSKEPHYFSEDLPGFRWATSHEEYLSYFAHVSSTVKVVGEASVYYLYSQVAAAKLRTFDPHARVIILLRNHLDFLPSFHSRLLYTRDEDVSDFGTAWHLQDERSRGRSIPKHCREPALLQYRSIASFAPQVQRYLSAFPRDQVKIAFFEEFFMDVKSSFESILDFLQLERLQSYDFPRINENWQHRNMWLGNLTQRPDPRLVSAGRALKRALGINRWSLLRSLRKLNLHAPQRDPFTPALALDLWETLADDRARLAELLQRPLPSRWTRAPAVSPAPPDPAAASR